MYFSHHSHGTLKYLDKKSNKMVDLSKRDANLYEYFLEIYFYFIHRVQWFSNFIKLWHTFAKTESSWHIWLAGVNCCDTHNLKKKIKKNFDLNLRMKKSLVPVSLEVTFKMDLK